MALKTLTCDHPSQFDTVRSRNLGGINEPDYSKWTYNGAPSSSYTLTSALSNR